MKAMQYRIKCWALVAACVLLQACAQTTASSGRAWQLVYHHDPNGAPLAGDKAALRAAVLAGQPLRIVWPVRADFWHAMDAGFLTVLGDDVLAQTHSIVRQIPDSENARFALDAETQSHWHAVFSTTGEVRSFQSQAGELSDHRYALQWYVQR